MNSISSSVSSDQERYPALYESSGFRDVTGGEVAFYQEHGWVKLKGLISPDVAADLRKLAADRMGLDGDSNAPFADEQNQGIGFFNAELLLGFQDSRLQLLVRACGRNAKALMDRGDDTGMRYMSDIFAVKLPAGKATRHKGNSRTEFHQDFPAWGLDRGGGMTMWFALADLTPESGTMEFLDGSHRRGSLGAVWSHPGRDLTDIYPRLMKECPSTGHMSYAAGDATVHSNMCVHGAGQNMTDSPRWAYIMGVNPEDACWTGGSEVFLPRDGLEQWKPLIDSRFPVIS